MNLEFEAIHKNAMEIACQFRRAESALIDILQLIDEKKIFYTQGFTSLFDYSVKALKLSESSASNFIVVARKSKTIPELKRAIATGDLTVSKARKITPVLTPVNQAHWIELAKNLPKHKLEKEIAKQMPGAATSERAKYVSETRIELKIGVSEDLMQKLRHAQNLLSQKLIKAATLEDTISELAQFFLSKQDPVLVAKRLAQKKHANGSPKIFIPNEPSSKNEPTSMPATKLASTGELADGHLNFENNRLEKFFSNAQASVPGTRYIEATLKHQIRLRDGFQCAHTGSKNDRCTNRRWLEIHHKVPLSQGGSNNLSNLQTLCSAHHRTLHRSH